MPEGFRGDPGSFGIDELAGGTGSSWPHVIAAQIGQERNPAGANSMTDAASPPFAPAAAIEIRVERTAQLFHTLDPFPFREKDLDPSAEKYIVDWARELGPGHPLRIVIHLPAKESGDGGRSEIAGAFENFFNYRAAVVAGDLKDLFRIGRRSLSIGILVLAVCLTVARSIPSGSQASTFGWILQQSVVILGWVANWRPLEIFLYDWWPLARRRDLYLRLAAARVELQSY
jgi:hypothetical protein